MSNSKVPTRIYNSIIAGASNIIKHSEILNETNGFPLPDKDTGSNLSYLMKYIIRNLKKSSNLKTLMNNLSDAAILGARGNSGSIFSQFFVGFGKGIDNNILDAFEQGYKFAYNSVKNPVEGTILTVMRDFKESTKDKSLEESVKKLKSSVKDTKSELKDFTENKYVDAGALAFQYFVEDFVEYYISEKEFEIIDYSLKSIDTESHIIDGDIK